LVTLTFAEVDPAQFRCTRADYHSADKAELSSKWVSHFPLARCIRDGALALESLIIEGDDAAEASVAGLPYGYPTRSNRAAWYPAFLETVERWQAAGMKPMDAYREVARRKRVPPNRVKQWVFQARKLRRENSE
jgi:hypothetical protein